MMWHDDVCRDRLLRYAASGTWLAPLDLAARGVLAAMDIAVDVDDVFVLDVPPDIGRDRLVRFPTTAGSAQGPAGRHPAPRSTSSSSVDRETQVLLERLVGVRRRTAVG